MKRAGKRARPRGARDPHAAFLDRLAQHFEHVPAELGHLVEEQHAVVGQADLAGPRTARRRRRVRRPRWCGAARGTDATTGGRRPRARRPATEWIDGDVQRFVEGQRRQDAPRAAAPSSSCPIRAGRPSACCDRRPPRSRAPASPSPGRGRQRSRHRMDGGGTAARGGGSRLLEPVRIVERAHRFGKRADAEQAEALDDRRFGVVGPGQEQRANVVAPRGGRDRQHAARRLDPAVERKLADQQHVVDVTRVDAAGGRQDAECDRQVERRRRPCGCRPARG